MYWLAQLVACHFAALLLLFRVSTLMCDNPSRQVDTEILAALLAAAVHDSESAHPASAFCRRLAIPTLHILNLLNHSLIYQD